VKCKHDSSCLSFVAITVAPDVMSSRRTWISPETGETRLSMHVRLCLDCNAAIPLGPSQDTGEHAERVAVEVRAAELALIAEETGDDPDDAMTVGEFNGWEIARLGGSGAIDDNRAPGWFAHAIATHQGES
jgi:hypothetical protein